MKVNKFRTFLIVLTAGASIVVAQQPATTAPKIKPSLIPQEKASNPAPSGNSQMKSQKNSIGRGKLTATTAQPVDFLQEQVAFRNGATVTTDFLYDSNVGVVYGYREDDFKCANGKPGFGGILEALYTSGNQMKKPVGSGWYAVELNENQCAAQESGIYGCRFDANGNATQCGAAALDSRTGDLEIAAEQQ